MSSYIVHATVKKYDHGFGATTKANVNKVFEAPSKEEAEKKARVQFIEDAVHPMISQISVEVDLINKID